MKVLLHTNCAGPGGCWSAGEVIEVSEAEAWELIAGKFATAVAPLPVEEEAINPTKTEKAVSRKRGK